LRFSIPGSLGFGVNGTDADLLQELVFAGMHLPGLGEGRVIVALDVEEAVEAVEEEFVAEGVAEFGGAAAGHVHGNDGVEVEGGGSSEF
jgi:hypothetical protein